MSIFRESFKQGVRDQLTKRQEAINNRIPKNLTYYNSRNAWIRMTSAVNVGGNNDLAKKYILQGGILNPNNKLRSGLGQDGSYSNVSPNGSRYGYVDATTPAIAGAAGIRPMPGITSLEVKSLGAYGSLREATVNFNVWSIQQLEELELLYMRPGYSVLIEWGWSPYLENNGDLTSTVLYNDDVLNGGVSKEEVWKKIHDKAKQNGNYDAVYGFIKNYSWSARMDGGYDCTVNVITMGEILESLKINYTAAISPITRNGMFSEIQKITGTPFSETSELAKAYNQNVLAGMCVEMYKIADSILGNNNEENITLTSSKGTDEYTFCKFNVSLNGKTDNSNTFIDNDSQIYITLKDFCKLINRHLLLQDDKGNSIAGVSTQEGYHNAKPGSDLLCLGDIYQISTDPSICLIKNDAWIKPEENLGIKGSFSAVKSLMEGLKTNYWYNGVFDVSSQKNGTPCLGVIGNIFVNLGYIYSLVTDEGIASQDKKEKREIPLFDFLKNMISGISTSIGNVADLDIFVDPEDSMARIIDVNYADIRKRKEAYDDAFVLNIHNLNSTVRSYKLESKIFPEQGAIIAIGAQVKGGALGTNTNTLVDFNQNLEDRIVKRKDDPTIPPSSTNEEEDAKNKIKLLKNNISIIVKYLNEIDADWYEAIFGNPGDFDVNESSKYANALRDIINFKKDLVKDDSKNRSIIPTVLSLDMDGIGGMIIGNMFRIPLDLLPKGYKGDGAGPARIAYLVTRLGHSVQNNDWVTKVEAQFIILDDPKQGVTGDVYNKIVADIILAAQTNPTAATNALLQATGGSQGDANAMRQAGNAVFNENGGKNSVCALYTYSIAANYVDTLNGKTPTGNLFRGKGNANDALYRNNLQALGYKMVSLGTLTKQQLIDYISKINTVGTIINYRSTVPVGGNNYPYTYGHTQIYTGGVLDFSNTSRWASSFGNNYGTGFVYNSINSDSWEAYIFTLPSSDPSSTSTGNRVGPNYIGGLGI